MLRWFAQGFRLGSDRDFRRGLDPRSSSVRRCVSQRRGDFDDHQSGCPLSRSQLAGVIGGQAEPGQCSARLRGVDRQSEQARWRKRTQSSPHGGWSEPGEFNAGSVGVYAAHRGRAGLCCSYALHGELLPREPWDTDDQRNSERPAACGIRCQFRRLAATVCVRSLAVVRVLQNGSVQGKGRGRLRPRLPIRTRPRWCSPPCTRSM